MERIKTFKSASEAIDLLDNGGQFYHIFTQADDDKISAAEVEKLSGSGREKQKAVLYLDLALSNLTPQERMAVEGRFDAYLNDSFTRYRPIALNPVRLDHLATCQSDKTFGWKERLRK